MAMLYIAIIQILKSLSGWVINSPAEVEHQSQHRRSLAFLDHINLCHHEDQRTLATRKVDAEHQSRRKIMQK